MQFSTGSNMIHNKYMPHYDCHQNMVSIHCKSESFQGNGGHTQWCQGLFLPFCSQVTPGGAGESNSVPGIKLLLVVCKINVLIDVLNVSGPFNPIYPCPFHLPSGHHHFVLTRLCFVLLLFLHMNVITKYLTLSYLSHLA